MPFCHLTLEIMSAVVKPWPYHTPRKFALPSIWPNSHFRNQTAIMSMTFPIQEPYLNGSLMTGGYDQSMRSKYMAVSDRCAHHIPVQMDTNRSGVSGCQRKQETEMGGGKWVPLQFYQMSDSVSSMLCPFISQDLFYFQLDVYVSLCVDMGM